MLSSWNKVVVIIIIIITTTTTRKGPVQARVSTDIFHDGLRRETWNDTRITRAQYPIMLAVHSVRVANF